MSMESSAVVAAAKAGDEAAFSNLAESYRRELQVHCYRMLGSFEDSEDAVQETFLRAWRRRSTYEGRAPFRAWLYRIATNASLDAIERRPERKLARADGIGNPAEVSWLEPFPDHLLDQIADADTESPESALVAKETIELAFMVAIQHLPARQRATLILRDVLGWSANETADLLESSVASVNGALARARTTMKEHLPPRRVDWAPGVDPSEEERRLFERLMDAGTRHDADAFAACLSEDVRLSMPPNPMWFNGRKAILDMIMERAWIPEFGEMRSIATRANRMPALAHYRRPVGEDAFVPMALDVMRMEGDGAVAEITTFTHRLFPAFGLPPEPPSE
jgi:RNA polymerase sigma-70 factor (ECF subfamily)